MLKEKERTVSCPLCPHDKPCSVDPSVLPTNQSLMKIIEFRKNEKNAFDKMKLYELENPRFFKGIEEVVTRDCKPHEIHLAEIKQDELIYIENIENPYLDKRNLRPN